MPVTASVSEAVWARAQLERILMATYIKGLKEESSRQLHYDPPKTFHEAVAQASRIEQVRVKSNSSQEI